jgi:alkylation response protein AidB-like acyl-CoA dehydrogenase
MGYLDLDIKMGRRLTAFQETVREFGRHVVRPAGLALDRLADPVEVIAGKSALWDVIRGFRERGLHRLMIPAAYGGTMGKFPSMATVILAEEMGYADGGLAISLLASGMPFAFALMSPHAEIRNWAGAYAEDLKGDIVGCWAITEPDHGTDWIMGLSKCGADPRLAPGLTAVKKGNEYILNGWKAAWVSNGTIATHAVLHVGLDSSQGVHGSGIALCPLNLPGISRGMPLNKMGQRALNQGEIIFDDVCLPEKYMLIHIPGVFGPNVFGHAFLGTANSTMGATFAGLGRAVLDETLNFARTNTRDGVLLADRKDIRIRLFRMFARVESARLFARKAADYFLAKSAGPLGSLMTRFKSTYWTAGHAFNAYQKAYARYPFVRDLAARFNNPEKPHQLTEWGKYGVASKITATETAFEVAGEALKIFGEEAFSPDHPIEKMLRDARAAMIEDGVNDALAMATYECL